MVYKRTYRKKKAYSKKATPWYNKKYSVGDMAATAYKGVKVLKGIINSEKKYFPFVGSTTISSTGSMTSLQQLAQGDTNITRNGNSIYVRSINFRMNATVSGSATASILRCILVQDNQQVADTSPAVTDILETASPLSFLALNTLGRFTVLWDKTFLLDNVNNKQKFIYYSNQTIQHHVRFNGTTATDVQKGGLYLLLVSDEVTNTPALDYNMRIGFYDN